MSRRESPYLLRAEFRPGATIDFDAYPFSIPAVRELDGIDFHPNVTFFVGENGSGKSNVLEGLAVALGFGGREEPGMCDSGPPSRPRHCTTAFGSFVADTSPATGIS